MGSDRQTLTETGFLADAVACAVPGFARRCQLLSLPRHVLQLPRYCLSFTAAGLRPELAAVIAAIHLEEDGDWARTKAAVLERNALQARSSSSGKRLESELRQRLQSLTNPQLQLLARGTSEERSAMAWLAVLKRIQIATDLTREVLLEKLSSLDPVLRRSEMTAFYERCEREHPELAALAASSQQKVRSALLQMLRDAGLLAGKPGKGGTLGSVQRPLVSPQVQAVLEDDDPSLLVGFLLSPAARQHKAGQAKATKLRTSAKPGSKPTRKPATKPAGQAAAKAAPGTPPKPMSKRATSSARRKAS